MSKQSIGGGRQRPGALAAVLVLSCLASPWWVATSQGQELAIRAGKIITAVGEPIENGVILIRDGRISAVGQGLPIPVDTRVIDASESVVMPGMIDPHNPSGMSQANERNAVVPFLSVVDSIDPSRSFFEESLRNGVTTAAVVPGNSTMIGGQAAIVKTAGQYVDDMLLVREAGLKISLQPPSGSRMSHLARLRRELEAARRQLKEKATKADASETVATEQAENGEVENGQAENDQDTSGNDELQSDEAALQDEEQEEQEGQDESEDSGPQEANALQNLLAGKTRAFIYCQNAADVGQAFRLMDEFEFSALLVLGQECYPAAEEIAARKATVILDPTLVYWKRDPVTRSDEKIVLPRIYGQAGVSYLFQSNDSSSRQSLGTSYFWFQAATAVRYGMSPEEAIQAVTIKPAQALGIDQHVGSIQVGRDADLVILTGDPLDVRTWVDKTLVNGQVVYQRDEDWKLKLLLEVAAQ